MTNVLRLDAGAPHPGSVTRELADEVVARLTTDADTTVVQRELTEGLPFVDNQWMSAAAGVDGVALSTSDELIAELKAADVIVLTAPVYNFGVPAALKAWIDQVVRVGETFNYTETGPVGKLENKRAVIVTASGGTEIEGAGDFAVPYLRFILGFIGIVDVDVVAASQQIIRGADVAKADAAAAIDRLVSA